ncbi:MAG TPA: DUF61 family protein [Sulfolobales archaeon]|nr:DUF61 family protein [Sulfolobales archaeon]
MELGGVRDPIGSYYKELVRSLTNMSPKDRKRLSEAARAEITYVDLVGGDRHAVLGSEAKDLASNMPRDLADHIRVPMIIAKVSGTSFYKLLDCNEKTSRMLLELRSRGVISSDHADRCILTQADTISLIKKYKTLFIISIIYGGDEGSHYEEDI